MLLQSLARLKEDFLRTKIGGSSPDVSTMSIPQEKSTTASQTDLRGEVSEQCLYEMKYLLPALKLIYGER